MTPLPWTSHGQGLYYQAPRSAVLLSTERLQGLGQEDGAQVCMGSSLSDPGILWCNPFLRHKESEVSEVGQPVRARACTGPRDVGLPWDFVPRTMGVGKQTFWDRPGALRRGQ